MPPRNHPDSIRVSFAEHHLVKNAGLIFPAACSRRHPPKLKPRWDVHLSGDDDQLGCAGESLSFVLGEQPGSIICPPTIYAFHLGFSLGDHPAQIPADRSPFARSASADGRPGSCGKRRQYRGRRRGNTRCFRRPPYQRQALCPTRRRGGRAPGPRPSGWSRPVRPCPIQQWR